jgi:hypothetical protein
MNLRKTQSGFGLIEALLVIIAVGIVGFGSFYVYNAHKSSKEPAVTSVTKPIDTGDKAPSQNNPVQKSPEVDPTASWKIFTAQGFSFKYPADWKQLAKPNSSQPDEFTSADYNEEEDHAPGLGGMTLTVGAKLQVRSEKSKGSLEDYEVGGTYAKRDIKVDGQSGFQADVKYEKQSYSQTVFQKNGFTYIVILRYPATSKDKNIGTYNTILGTFKVF